MEERDIVFRDKLIEMVSSLRMDDGQDPALRRLVGIFAHNLMRQSTAPNWAAFKAAIDSRTYNSLLGQFQTEGKKASAKGDHKAITALDILGMSLVARMQKQVDLAPGVEFLDRYIERCAHAIRTASAGTPSQKSPAH